MNRVLIVSVHPDDETLGCGGTILKYKALGYSVSLLTVTDGNSSQAESNKLLVKEYDLDDNYCLGLPELDLADISLNKIIPLISEIFYQYKPNLVFIPNRSDVHSDHTQTFNAVKACLKTFRYPFIKKIMMYEVVSETDFSPALPENVFIPNVFVDISDSFDRKIDIYKRLYSDEILKDNYTRSLSCVEAHNRYRGSVINANYAESFMLIKEIL